MVHGLEFGKLFVRNWPIVGDHSATGGYVKEKLKELVRNAEASAFSGQAASLPQFIGQIDIFTAKSQRTQRNLSLSFVAEATTNDNPLSRKHLRLLQPMAPTGADRHSPLFLESGNQDSLLGPDCALLDQLSGSGRLIDDRPILWGRDGFALADHVPGNPLITASSARTRPSQGIHGCKRRSARVPRSVRLEHPSRTRRRDWLQAIGAW